MSCESWWRRAGLRLAKWLTLVCCDHDWCPPQGAPTLWKRGRVCSRCDSWRPN